MASSPRSVRTRWVGGERAGALEEGSCRGKAGATYRGARDPHQFGGNGFVGLGGGRRQVPDPSFRVGAFVGRLRQRCVSGTAFVRRTEGVCGGADEWMPEAHSLADREQPLRLRGDGGILCNSGMERGTPQQRGVPGGVRRGKQQQPARWFGKRCYPTPVVLLQLGCD